MEQKNRKPAAFSNVRKEFYKQVLEKDRKQKLKIVALALSALLLASSLLFVSSLIETSGKGKYVYVYGDYEQSINSDICFEGNIQLIDMNALADYCGIDKEEVNYVATFAVNNTCVYFEDNSKIATINGIKKEMPTKAQIKNGYCLVPMSIVAEIVFGIEIKSDKNSTNITKIAENMYIIDRNPNIEYSPEASSYFEYINSKDEYIYLIVNKEHPLDRNFPEDENILWEIPAEYRKAEVIKLHYIAEKSLEAMMQDMFSLGYKDTYVTSAYRSYNYQEWLFYDYYVQNLVNNGMSYDNAYAEVLKDTALPGQSEHQTGLCVDFTTKSIGTVDNIFAETEVFSWLKENSWKYGFILRYPEDKESITGYMYESWHYRFVGFEVASIMHQTGLCYEEYLEIFGVK